MSNNLKNLEIITKWNFWNKEPINSGFPRDITEKIKDYIKGPEVIALKGVRRSGKSTIMLQVIKELILNGAKPTNIIYINFEEPFFIENKGIEIIENIYNVYREQINPDKFSYMFLDEIQKIPGWEKWVRAKTDLKEAKIFVTGSSSKILSSEISTLLTGRNISFTVYPLSFREFINFKGIKEVSGKIQLLKNKTLIKKLLTEYMKFGGFPDVVLKEKPDVKEMLLKQYFEDILYKDIVSRHKVRDLETLKNIAYFYLTNISNLVSYNKIMKMLDTPMDVIRSYSSYLYESFLVKDVLKYSFKVKEQLRNPKKVYSVDVGLRNAVSYRFSEDYGKIAENIVFSKLISMGKEIYYYKNTGEVDFVTQKGLKAEALIQVSMIGSDDEKAVQREIKSLQDGMSSLQINEGLLITDDWNENIKLPEGKVSIVPLWMWLLE